MFLYLVITVLLTAIFYCRNCLCQLKYHDNKLHRYIIQKCSYIRNRFYFTPYIFTGFLQAVYASKVQDVDTKVKFKRTYIDFGLDFGYFALDWGYYQGILSVEQADNPQGKPIIIVLSGLTASKSEPYITQFFSQATQNPEWRVVLLNDRIYNNRFYIDPKRSALPQYTILKLFVRAGYMNQVEDIRRLIEHLSDKFHSSSFYAVGHSFGANTLVRYIGMCGANNIKSRLQAAVSVSNPYDFQLASKYIEDGLGDRYVRQQRQKVLGLKIDQFKPSPKHISLNYDDIFSAKTAKQFDVNFTVKIFGAPSIDYHFLSLACVNMIAHIQIPMFFIGSSDDPVINSAGIPYDEIEQNSNIILFYTRVGGHISWLEGFFKPSRWYQKPVVQYLKAIIDYQSQQKRTGIN